MALSVALGAREIPDDFLWLAVRFFLDGAVRVQELVGDVGEDGGPAGGDAALGNQDEQPGEKLADICARGELGEFREQVGGEVFGVVRRGRERKTGGDLPVVVPEAEARLGRQAGQAAASAIGITIVAARRIVEELARATPSFGGRQSRPGFKNLGSGSYGVCCWVVQGVGGHGSSRLVIDLIFPGRGVHTPGKDAKV